MYFMFDHFKSNLLNFDIGNIFHSAAWRAARTSFFNYYLNTQFTNYNLEGKEK